MITFSPKDAPADELDVAVVSGKATESDARKFARQAGRRQLILNVFRGWDGDLDTATRVFRDAKVEAVSVFGTQHVDISLLERLDALVDLHVAGLVHGDLLLDWFPRLESFGFGAELKGKGKVRLEWGTPRRLVRIIGSGAKLPSMKALAIFPSLQELSIGNPAFEPRELEQLEGLVNLDLSYWRKLTSFRQLERLGPRLKRLRLYCATKLRDYHGIEKMIALEHLYLEKCPPFPSVGRLSNLQLLEELCLIDMKVTDGDLAPLMDMSRLLDVGLASHRHYVPSRPDLERFFDAKRKRLFL